MLNKILNLSNVIIKDYCQLDEVTCIFVVESGSKNAVCPRCGTQSKNVHQNHWYLVKDLSVCGQNTYLKVNRRQWKCQQCNRSFSEELEWLKKIGKWLEQARKIFPESSKTIRNWIGEIISYFDNRTTQGKVEGINNKIKLVKRLAYSNIRLCNVTRTCCSNLFLC